ncbi:hypothetical protein R6Q57_001082 [Mikania cordata]
MEEGSSRGGSSSRKFKNPRPKNIQNQQTNPFNTPGYHPYIPMQGFAPYSPGTQQQFNRWEQSFVHDQSSQQFEWQQQQQFHQQSPFQEEEPVRAPEKRPQRRKAAKRWSDEEGVALAKSWLTVSENPEVGNTQKRDGFYRKVTDHFHELMKDTSRTVDQIYSKWGDLNATMKKWNGFYQQASMSRKSGEADDDVLKKIQVKGISSHVRVGVGAR